ncbi:FMN-binding protein [Sphaerochaeta sp. PS]|uniref:FMN-binding protein n=1 Tax=Sphaerochaeta sp. PS TaxID=3076336 RepID=UPI0028A40A74|nr:FMN-binding protein [Sphaerochaeta sp. PS]MDT4762025.1 FMN-binding protein [Sphaerochaeta sp. PS]
MRRRTFILVAIIAILLVLTVSGRLFMQATETNLENLRTTRLQDIQLATLSDGSYGGAYSCFPIAVELEVQVQDHRIADIRLLKHRNGQGKAAEAILPLVVAKQSLQLDAISGATYSSIVILKAIEAALQP